MSNYYDYREVKVMIAHRLMAMDGWKIFGYRADESDSMTDYWSPASWDGIATKNGYTLCVDVYGKAEPKEIREYNYNNNTTSNINVMEKIQKLEAITTQRGATESEEITAKEKITLLREKSEMETTERNKYIVTGYVPGHMEHPPKCNWHIEKDGMIIAKGNGILKYSDLYYYSGDKDKSTLESIKEGLREYYSDNEKLEKAAQNTYNDALEKRKLFKKFNEFINKIDTACGGLLGEGEGTIYEKVIVTKYKEENKVVECDGEIKEGQYFILKSNFVYGKRKGLVYKIHEINYENGEKRYHAYKLNRKLTKECTGSADASNEWYAVGSTHFNKWIESGNIVFCNIETEKIPYEVEKVVKKTVRTKKKAVVTPDTATQQETTTENDKTSKLEYSIEESKHTKTNEDLWLVKIKSKLSKDEFKEVKQNFATLSGYYSKFTHSFIFKYDPTEKIKSA